MGSALDGITGPPEASAITVADAGGVFSGSTVEAILAELEAMLPVKKIETITRATDGTIDFQNIPATYEYLEIRAFLRSAQANTEEQLRVRLNNDAATACQSGYVSQQNNAVALVNDVGNAYVVVGSVPGNSAVAERFAAVRILLPGYASARHKSIEGSFAYSFNTGAAQNRQGQGGGTWPVTTAINRVLLWTGSGAGNLLAGSKATVYGWRS